MAAAVPAFVQAQAAPKPPVAVQKPHMVKGPQGPHRPLLLAARRHPQKTRRCSPISMPRTPIPMRCYGAAEAAAGEALFEEIVGRIKQDDSTRPVARARLLVLHPLRHRRRLSDPRPQDGERSAREKQVMLDQPAMAKGNGFFAVSDWDGQPRTTGCSLIAEDTCRPAAIHAEGQGSGDRARSLGDVSARTSSRTSSGPTTTSTIFYIEKDPVTLLSKRVKAHVLGTPASADKLVYEEKDDSFYMGVGRTSDDKFICIGVRARSATSSAAPAPQIPGEWTVLAPREREFRYDGGPCRRPLGHPHQLERAELQADDRRATGRGVGQSGLERPRPAQRERVHRGLRAVRQLHRDRGEVWRQQTPPAARQ